MQVQIVQDNKLIKIDNIKAVSIRLDDDEVILAADPDNLIINCGLRAIEISWYSFIAKIFSP